MSAPDDMALPAVELPLLTAEFADAVAVVGTAVDTDIAEQPAARAEVAARAELWERAEVAARAEVAERAEVVARAEVAARFVLAGLAVVVPQTTPSAAAEHKAVAGSADKSRFVPPTPEKHQHLCGNMNRLLDTPFELLPGKETTGSCCICFLLDFYWSGQFFFFTEKPKSPAFSPMP